MVNEPFYCPNCGYYITDDSKFCEYCGTRLNRPQTEQINLRCSDCGATMEYRSKEGIVFCPYCGSKNIVSESESMKKARVAGQTYKDIRMHGQQMKRDVEIERIKLEKERLKAQQSEEHRRIEEQKREIERLNAEKRAMQEKEDRRREKENPGCIAGLFSFFFVDLIGGILKGIIRIITFGWIADLFDDAFDDGPGCLGCIPNFLKIIAILIALLAVAAGAASA